MGYAHACIHPGCYDQSVKKWEYVNDSSEHVYTCDKHNMQTASWVLVEINGLELKKEKFKPVRPRRPLPK